LSMDGHMPNSDIIMGYISTSCPVGCVNDYYAPQYYLPTLDTQQDIELVSASRVGPKLVLEWKRKLDTKDPTQDRPINITSSIKFIWSANLNSVPQKPDSFSKHTNTSFRGIDLLLSTPYKCGIQRLKITFTNVSKEELDIPTLLSRLNALLKIESRLYVVNVEETESPCSSCKIMEAKFDRYVVPSAETNYICSGFAFPTDTKYHVIHFEPIQDNNEVLHHMLLYASFVNYSVGEYTSCTSMPYGTYPIYGWSPGNDVITIPEEAGYLVGNDEDAPQFLIVQTHYDNPTRKSGLVDSSGFRLYLTDKLRPYNAGFMFFGVPEENINIPPLQDNWHQAGVCSSDVTDGIKNIPGGKLHIFSYLFHEHLLGKQMWTEVIRNDEKLTEFTELNYNFNHQRFIPISFEVLPGDQLITRCVWSSTHRNTTTVGGVSTRDEMCLLAILYYPDARRKSCNSALTDSLSCEYPCNELPWRSILKPGTISSQYIYMLGGASVILVLTVIGTAVFFCVA